MIRVGHLGRSRGDDRPWCLTMGSHRLTGPNSGSQSGFPIMSRWRKVDDPLRLMPLDRFCFMVAAGVTGVSMVLIEIPIGPGGFWGPSRGPDQLDDGMGAMVSLGSLTVAGSPGGAVRHPSS